MPLSRMAPSLLTGLLTALLIRGITNHWLQMPLPSNLPVELIAPEIAPKYPPFTIDTNEILRKAVKLHEGLIPGTGKALPHPHPMSFFKFFSLNSTEK